MSNKALTAACSDHATTMPGIQISGPDTKSASSSTRAVHELSDQSSNETNSTMSTKEMQVHPDASKLINA